MVSVCYTVKMAAGQNKDKSEPFSKKKPKKNKTKKKPRCSKSHESTVNHIYLLSAFSFNIQVLKILRATLTCRLVLAVMGSNTSNRPVGAPVRAV